MSTVSKTISKKAVMRQFTELRKIDLEIQGLDKDLRKKGFVALRAPKNFWATQTVFREKGELATFELHVQDFKKAKSKDIAALAQISISARGHQDRYSFYLIASEGDFKKVKEYTVSETMRVIKTKSWWTCVKKRILKKCAAPCITALITCSGTWAAYLACVALACGICWTKVTACCGCNCKWYCRYVVGCCRK